MNYKKSKYNYFIPYEDGKTILYNFYSNFTSIFTKDELDRYEKDLLTENEQEELYKRGFLINPDVDEFKLVNDIRLKENLNSHEKLYRIWTTSACNARCFYCFEKGVKVETLTEERCDKVIEYISKNINENDRISIEWFGGEPLLNTLAIDKLTKAIKYECEVKNAKYTSYFISNGSLITPEIINKMENEWKTKYIQITLDGAETAYNKIKNYIDPEKYNFNKVINNIMLFKNTNINVSIRINYTEDNYNDIIELIRYIGPKLQDSKNIIAYVYPIWSNLKSDIKDIFISNVQADQNLINIFDEIVKYNLNKVKKIIRINRKITSCKSCNIGSCTILPNGDISKCSESFNKVYGNIYDGIIDKTGYDNWSNHSLSNECKECVFLPICQGGCEANNYINMPKCFAYKPIINDMIIWYVNKLKNT